MRMEAVRFVLLLCASCLVRSLMGEGDSRCILVQQCGHMLAEVDWGNKAITRAEQCLLAEHRG